MKTISVAMIVKNESAVIERILSCLNFADEIIIADTGSWDDTKLKAEKFGAKVYDFDWIDDFSAARNFAFSKAQKNYIMWLDADDVITVNDAKKIIEWKNSDPLCDVVMAKYVTALSEDGEPLYWFYRERIIKNCRYAKWRGKIHEAITPFGKTEYGDFCVIHKPLSSHTERNLAVFEKLKKDGELDARNEFYYARELLFCKKYYKAALEFKRFLKKNGYFIDKISALTHLSDICAIKNDDYNAKKYLTETFTLSLPRAEQCCKLADIFFKENKLTEAEFWYERATFCKEKDGFICRDYFDLIPLTKLCVCRYKQGDIAGSFYWHEKAKKIRPFHPTVKYNEQFFDSLKK